MALILSIETTTTNCSVAISEEGKTIVLKEDNGNGYSHAESLHVFIDEVIKSANIQGAELDAIAISKGPGSYTGLRIGVSAAKGLCFSLDKPLISVSTLEALACQVNAFDGVIVPMLDARRLEVYSAIFDNNYKAIREVQAEVLDADSYAKYLENGSVHFVGNGVEKTKGLISHPNAIFVEGKLPSAKEMGALAYDKFKKNDIEDVAYFEPFYLKDFIALKPKS
ncbi:tRNA (adenosine(37)-N6)-threonylcarbamoyltransferase complex dimerization subunit type 1 TsaB [Mangrovimonas sp. YM274]|uniref:tRNA (adenosine(37)-N6)-threonylcarbamoyltransferase complex dimerization subunit type 1 TsaB n=1 Tax=Mangrovimonas sp. YM274 TaxID=3070660 RepID=UPI0027DC7144|nr:tRNA (adenosine(37)-N6)-threonylcarbamoyltransferase complex dimerization subunit type 1 TsaB [Mangrovimonas sp. YM274]WMI69418.1 tRNA (adenosine(37)-N6)-threonylcarbamoyltransferase complex dimerization subunit type 1 TsaB [Mangrovimonas sp. YM274]